ESLQEYILVSQNNKVVEQYLRKGEEWSLSVFRSVEDVMQLASIECKLALRAIYAKVKFVE
ncbi:Uma2 family endonuclease, partial [Candidatus Poribacteria bacterium]|nr:Uma2 family endonuclease [Candidatus Poribacteria bacterium]